MLEKFRNRIGKRGMVLAELMVALALLGLVSTAIVSFSAVVSSHVESQQSQYAFLEETAQIRDSLSAWLSQMDEDGAVCTVTAENLSVSAYGASAAFDGENLVLTHRDGTVTRVETDTLTRVQFARKELSNGDSVVKCTLTGAHNRNERYAQTFVLYLRCGSFAG